jgi:DNA topoisomerase-1
VSKPLVIVESPAKARTIGKFLGAGFTVKASMGHVRDLPRSGLHVYPEKRFDADWEPIKERTKIVSELRRALEKADTLYLATDPDREGEAIAWHLVELLADRKQKEGELEIKRVVFHEITKDAIKEAFDHPAKVNEDLVNAYRARRILDRLVGYQLSELLWRKLTRGLSAGRVQSVAVKLVVEREREIRAFVPQEFWKVVARFGKGEQAFTAEFKRLDGKTKELATVADTLQVLERAKGDGEQLPAPVETGAAPERAQATAQSLAEIRGGRFTLSSLKQAPKRVSAKPPFKTSTLQQAAAGRYGFTAKRTMRVAQQLYEGIDLPGEGAVGLITYMRTDSFNIALAARNAARDLIRDAWGERFLPEKPNSYRSREGAQEAHEAIRPTEPRRRPESLRKALTDEQWKLYDLIWRRFIACQMAPAEYLVTTLELLRAGAAFAASGRVTTFAGFTQVYGLGGDKDEEQRLPELTEGQTLDSTAIVSTQHFTSPPRRYSEASLVKALEEDGIGRPSTYASILSTIVDRRYVDHGEEAEMESRRTKWLGGEGQRQRRLERRGGGRGRGARQRRDRRRGRRRRQRAGRVRRRGHRRRAAPPRERLLRHAPRRGHHRPARAAVRRHREHGLHRAARGRPRRRGRGQGQVARRALGLLRPLLARPRRRPRTACSTTAAARWKCPRCAATRSTRRPERSAARRWSCSSTAAAPTWAARATPTAATTCRSPASARRPPS